MIRILYIALLTCTIMHAPYAGWTTQLSHSPFVQRYNTLNINGKGPYWLAITLAGYATLCYFYWKLSPTAAQPILPPSCPHYDFAAANNAIPSFPSVKERREEWQKTVINETKLIDDLVKIIVEFLYPSEKYSGTLPTQRHSTYRYLTPHYIAAYDNKINEPGKRPVSLWYVPSGAFIKYVGLGGPYPPLATNDYIAISPDELFVAYNGENACSLKVKKIVHVRHELRDELTLSDTEFTKQQVLDGIRTLRFLDNKRLAVLDSDDRLTIWNIHTQKVEQAYTFPPVTQNLRQRAGSSRSHILNENHILLIIRNVDDHVARGYIIHANGSIIWELEYSLIRRCIFIPESWSESAGRVHIMGNNKIAVRDDAGSLIKIIQFSEDLRSIMYQGTIDMTNYSDIDNACGIPSNLGDYILCKVPNTQKYEAHPMDQLMN